MLFYTPLRSGAGRGNDAGHVRDQLSAYIDYELSDAEREQVREHLRRCPDCENELATLKATKQVLADMPLMTAPRSFVLTPAMVGREAPAPVVRHRLWSLAGRLRAASAVSALVFLLVFLTNEVLPASYGASATHVTTAAERSSELQGLNQAPSAVEPTTTTAAAAATNTTMPPMLGFTSIAEATPVPPGAGGAASGAGDTPAPAAVPLATIALDQFAPPGTAVPAPVVTPAPAANNTGLVLPGGDTRSSTGVVQPKATNPGPLPANAVSPLASLSGVRLLEGVLLVLAVGLALGSLLAVRQSR